MLKELTMAEITGRPKILKKVNRTLVIEALTEMGSATRVELAGKTKISQPTVNSIVRELLNDGVITEKGEAISSGGRRAQIYQLNFDFNCVLAVIVYPTEFHYSVVNLAGESLEAGISKISNKNITESLTQLISSIIVGRQNITTISIGVPGAVDNFGRIFAIPQLQQWEGVNLQQELAKKYPDYVITLENDMNAMALGYYETVQEAEIKDLVYAYVGDGLGMGIIANGNIINGFSSFAGEVGYMFTGDVNTESHEAYAPFEVAFKHSIENNHSGEVIGRMIVNVICVLNPPMIVFGGKYASDKMLTDIENYCIKHLPTIAIPGFEHVKNEEEYYFTGLVKKGYQKADETIRITK